MIKKYLLLLAIFIGINSTVFGFATVVTAVKGGDTITFNTNTQSVSVYLNNQMIGTANDTFTYKVKRNKIPKVFTFKKAGYNDVKITLTTQLDNIFWANLVIGGSFGSSTDSWITNNSQMYSPNQFYISMVKG